MHLYPFRTQDCLRLSQLVEQRRSCRDAGTWFFHEDLHHLDMTLFAEIKRFQRGSEPLEGVLQDSAKELLTRLIQETVRRRNCHYGQDGKVSTNLCPQLVMSSHGSNFGDVSTGRSGLAPTIWNASFLRSTVVMVRIWSGRIMLRRLGVALSPGTGDRRKSEAECDCTQLELVARSPEVVDDFVSRIPQACPVSSTWILLKRSPASVLTRPRQCITSFVTANLSASPRKAPHRL